METYILDRQNYSSERVIDLLAKGKQPLCPVCKSLIFVVTTAKQARELQMPPGMRCSKNIKHFDVEFIIKP